jgi:uncharacterized protein YbaR (Trm112 family)
MLPDLLEFLRCPVTGQRLAPASPERLARLEAQRRAGKLTVPSEQPQWDSGSPLEAVLVRDDGRIGYIVQGGIPILLPDHGVEIA